MKKLILSITIIATAFIVSCGGGSSDPKSVAKSFLEARQKSDYTTAKKYCTEETKSMLDVYASMGASIPDSMKKAAAAETFTFGDAKIEGEKASITYKASSSPDEQTCNLVKKDGKWLVAQSKDPGAGATGVPADSTGAKEEAMPVDPAKKK